MSKPLVTVLAVLVSLCVSALTVAAGEVGPRLQIAQQGGGTPGARAAGTAGAPSNNAGTAGAPSNNAGTAGAPSNNAGTAGAPAGTPGTPRAQGNVAVPGGVPDAANSASDMPQTNPVIGTAPPPSKSIGTAGPPSSSIGSTRSMPTPT